MKQKARSLLIATLGICLLFVLAIGTGCGCAKTPEQLVSDDKTEQSKSDEKTPEQLASDEMQGKWAFYNFYTTDAPSSLFDPSKYYVTFNGDSVTLCLGGNAYTYKGTIEGFKPTADGEGYLYSISFPKAIDYDATIVEQDGRKFLMMIAKDMTEISYYIKN